MKSRVLLSFVAFTLASCAIVPDKSVFAQDSDTKDSKIIWSCTDIFGTKNILWLVEWGTESYIKVFDERIPADYSVDGISKRWSWGLDESDFTYEYAIVLAPDRNATYYNFRGSKDGSAKPSDFYKCSK